MKQQSKLLLALLQGAGVGSLIPGAGFLANEAAAGISNTRHNLANQTVGWNRLAAGGTGEVCVFCHTPHAADTTTTEAPPLWNKRLGTGATYTTYAQLNTATLDADAQYGTTTTGSASLACLSCHDGTQAMDNIINAPGSGGWDSTGGNAIGRTGTGWTWASGNGERTDADGKLASGAVTNLTPDLRNDHPIGIAYCGGTASGTFTSGTTTGCRDGDFKPLNLASGSGTGSDSQWFVETSGGAASRDKADIILYTRAISGANVPTVECGSCHDPHVETKATNQVAFLRVSQVNSGVCLSCHIK